MDHIFKLSHIFIFNLGIYFWFIFLAIFSFSQKPTVEICIPIFTLSKIMHLCLRVGTQTNFNRGPTTLKFLTLPLNCS